MKTKRLTVVIFISLLFTACSPSVSAAGPTEAAAIEPKQAAMPGVRL